MHTVYLNRFAKSNQGTFGIWACPAFGFSCFSLELPWRNNATGISCIPTDTYIVKSRWSKKYGWHFHITNVKGRSWILLHSGNFAGDETLGYRTHSHGCILLGKTKGLLQGQQAILNSRITVRKFNNLMQNQTFKLIIS